MPTDPRIWRAAPLRSRAIRPVSPSRRRRSRGRDGRLPHAPRALREGLICRRRKLDHTEALAAVARAAGLDAERFRVDVGSHAIVEAFGADLEIARDVPDVVRERGLGALLAPVGEERVPFPMFRFEGEDGELGWSCGWRSVEHIRQAAVEAGAAPSGAVRPTVREAFGRFGRLAAPEVAAVCDLLAAAGRRGAGGSRGRRPDPADPGPRRKALGEGRDRVGSAGGTEEPRYRPRASSDGQRSRKHAVRGDPAVDRRHAAT